MPEAGKVQLRRGPGRGERARATWAVWATRAACGALLLGGLVGMVGAEPRRVGVLELEDHAGLGESIARALGDEVRGEVLVRLGAGWQVLTRENILALAPPGALEGCAGDCEVEIGRRLGVAFIVTGAVTRFGDKLRVALRAHATENGTLAGRGGADAEAVERLDEAARAAAAELVAPLAAPREAPEAAVARAPARAGVLAPLEEPMVSLSVTSEARGVQLRLRGEAGVVPLCYAPCEVQVPRFGQFDVVLAEDDQHLGPFRLKGEDPIEMTVSRGYPGLLGLGSVVFTGASLALTAALTSALLPAEVGSFASRDTAIGLTVGGLLGVGLGVLLFSHSEPSLKFE